MLVSPQINHIQDIFTDLELTLADSTFGFENTSRDFELADQKLSKFSTKRLIVSGPIVELYEYSRAYLYNLSVKTDSRASGRVLKDSRRSDSLYRTRSMIRRIVDSNCLQYGFLPIFITFTFGTEVFSPKVANPIWSLFIKRLSYRYKTKFRYLSVIEFQPDSKRVHYHVIFFDLPFIKNIKKEWENLWGNGWIKVVSVRDVKLVGHYVSKYLREDIGDKRLVGQKAYFCSRNVNRPVVYRELLFIDNFLTCSNMNLDYKSDIKLPYNNGNIIYKKFKLNEYNSNRNNWLST